MLFSDPTAGEVRIGSTAPLGASFVAAIIDRLSRRFPRMVFHIVSEDANSLIRDLDERKLDLLILRKIGPFAEDRQSFEVLYDNPYFVAAARRTRFDGVASSLPSSSMNCGFCRRWAVGSDRLPEIFSTHRNCYIPAHLWSRLPLK